MLCGKQSREPGAGGSEQEGGYLLYKPSDRGLLGLKDP